MLHGGITQKVHCKCPVAEAGMPVGSLHWGAFPSRLNATHPGRSRTCSTAEATARMTASRPTAASATAVTAGGMLMSRRRGSTMRPGRSTVSSLVRKACRWTDTTGMTDCQQWASRSSLGPGLCNADGRLHS